MALILSVLCVVLLGFHGVEGNVKELVIKEKQPATITCDKNYPSTVFWLRLKENGQGFEYIASYSKTKKSGKVAEGGNYKVAEKTFDINSFETQKDSGTYSCVFINNNQLEFSSITKLRGETVPTTIKPKVQTTPMPTVPTTKAVVTCGQNSRGKKAEKIDVLLGCELHIFIPLAAGCGFLLLLLLITILYCNRIRTRRCPHHYKRQPRGRAPGHKTLPNPPDY
ncbi:T-cell surface glycoprotein CD8 alpha chain precursor [Ictalurus punctatus]|uniref:CD8 alpha n=1 Tax=Ictalurus punctatus TaxID=7998 RepID=C6KE06_ICTPU|nr:T-cell surface glycoprotein CD8 alpha chain precursor [Ictalurus punctatus]ACS66820.1 CD8 alpha [Ictalurus punctatus]AED99295.1 CD8 alpha [Ictalurus punctatus]